MAQDRFVIRGARPAVLSPAYGDDLLDTWDPTVAIEHLTVLPMFNPVDPNVPVEFLCNGQPCTPQDVTGLAEKCYLGSMNYDINDAMNEVASKGLLAYGYSNIVGANMLFVNQAAAMNGYQIASEVIHYTPMVDIIPAAKEFLAGVSPIDKFFVGVGYTYKPHTLGFWCLNKQVFNDFISFCAVEAARLDANLNTDAKLAIANLSSLTLDELTCGLLLRAFGAEDAGDAEGTFARFIVEAAMEFSQQNPHTFGVMPFDVGELVQPHSVVFANVDMHAHSFPEDVKHAWEDVNTAIASKPKVLSQNQIRNLTAAQTALRKAKKKAQKADEASNRKADATQREIRPFSRKWSSCRDLLTKRMLRVMKRLGQVNRSENMYKYVKSTYMRPNRRDPENGDLMGKTITLKYKPDIHLYLDTSGSISEENYQAAVLSCIKMAQKLNVNLYFNSFSHEMSTCTKLQLRNKTVGQIYKEFQKVKKVGGGTDYKQIWDYINASKKRQKEFSLIITDFEWSVPRYACKHPKNLYYFPVASREGWEWERLCREAQDFARNMLHLDPKIRQKLLF